MKEIMIKCNVGTNERKLRLVLGAAGAVGMFLTPNPALRVVLGGLGLATIATAATRYCPVNDLLGIRRCQPAYRAFPHLLRRL